jgi:hypothetical protein
MLTTLYMGKDYLIQYLRYLKRNNIPAVKVGMFSFKKTENETTHEALSAELEKKKFVDNLLRMAERAMATTKTVPVSIRENSALFSDGSVWDCSALTYLKNIPGTNIQLLVLTHPGEKLSKTGERNKYKVVAEVRAIETKGSKMLQSYLPDACLVGM